MERNELFTKKEDIIEHIKYYADWEGVTILESAIHVCEKYGIEEEYLGQILRRNKEMKDLIQQDALKLRMIDKPDEGI